MNIAFILPLFHVFMSWVDFACVLSLSFSMLHKFEKGKGTLKDQISAIKPILEELRLKKKQRVEEFSEIQSQIACICAEIAGNGQSKNYGDPQVNDNDLTAKRLAELKLHLKELQTEKVRLVNCDAVVLGLSLWLYLCGVIFMQALRLQKVIGHLGFIHELSVTMSIDFLNVVHEVHPSLSNSSCGNSKSISNDTLAGLTDLINSLKQQKQQRLKKVRCY